MALLTEAEERELKGTAQGDPFFAREIGKSLRALGDAYDGESDDDVFQLVQALVEDVALYSKVENREFAPVLRGAVTDLERLIQAMLQHPMFAAVVALNGPLRTIDPRYAVMYVNELRDGTHVLELPDDVRSELQRLEVAFEQCREREPNRFADIPLGSVAEAWFMAEASQLTPKVNEDDVRDAMEKVGTPQFVDAVRKLPLRTLPDGHFYFHAGVESARIAINAGLQHEGVQEQLMQIHRDDRKHTSVWDWLAGNVNGMAIAYPIYGVGRDAERQAKALEDLAALVEIVRSEVTTIEVQPVPLHPRAFDLLSAKEQEAYAAADDIDKSIVGSLVQMHAHRAGIPVAEGEYRAPMSELAANLVARMSRHAAIVLDDEAGPVVNETNGPGKPLRDIFKTLLNDPAIAVGVVMFRFRNAVHEESLKFYRGQLNNGGPNSATLTAGVVDKFSKVYDVARQRPGGRFSDIPFLAALEAATSSPLPPVDRANPFNKMDDPELLNTVVAVIGERAPEGVVRRNDVDVLAKHLSHLPYAFTESGLLVFERGDEDVRPTVNMPLRHPQIQAAVMGLLVQQRLGRSFFDAFDNLGGGDIPVVVRADPGVSAPLRATGIETLPKGSFGQYL